MKHCNKCNLDLPETMFYMQKSIGKRHTICNPCRKEHNKKSNKGNGLSRKEKDSLPINYVYKHIDEESNIVYIGVGRDGRAWDFSMRRDPEHSMWLVSEMLKGRGPQEISILIDSLIIYSEASDLETKLIKEIKPRFNREKVK